MMKRVKYLGIKLLLKLFFIPNSAMAVCDLLLLTMGIGTLIVIPAWNPPSLEIEIVYPLCYPIGNISYMGSLYLTILLSFERYMALCHRQSHYRKVPQFYEKHLRFGLVLGRLAILKNIFGSIMNNF